MCRRVAPGPGVRGHHVKGRSIAECGPALFDGCNEVIQGVFPLNPSHSGEEAYHQHAILAVNLGWDVNGSVMADVEFGHRRITVRREYLGDLEQDVSSFGLVKCPTVPANWGSRSGGLTSVAVRIDQRMRGSIGSDDDILRDHVALIGGDFVSTRRQ
jgi:hypothetical protein